eukprot:CAMPEP_0194290944 /NCGR_PEP_ID=MMETSP0169-20130528/42401_1 /TAXON_ID=218684 /ORGANISM="Corethron pennatum, Strain L29A3" /LENGTH=372 /DNA_ID=CAMNT_0039038685 /DNA_START=171 /DNA_END=1290 /DNA_ORIENTATION=-
MRLRKQFPLTQMVDKRPMAAAALCIGKSYRVVTCIFFSALIVMMWTFLDVDLALDLDPDSTLSIAPTFDFSPDTTLSITPASATSSSMCFVHLGKTGGTALGCALNRHIQLSLSNRALCQNKTERVGSPLHTAVRERVHLVSAPVLDNRFDSFLLTLRDPVARMVSWYFYLHPNYPPQKKPHHKRLCHHMVFFQCWPTLKSFTEVGLNITGAGISTCDILARDIARGTVHCWQNYWNYERTYGPLLDSNKTVYVVRTEYLWRDFDEIEAALIGSGSEPTTVAGQTSGGGSEEVTNRFERNDGDELSLLGVQGSLSRDTGYKKTLLLSANLSAAEKEKTQQELVKTCPLEASWAGCGKQGEGVLQNDPLVHSA